jgi:hypothetical protein
MRIIFITVPMVLSAALVTVAAMIAVRVRRAYLASSRDGSSPSRLLVVLC